MRFDPREQRALRAAGLDQANNEAVSGNVLAATDEAAGELSSVRTGHDVVHSDVNLAHDSDGIQHHDVESLDLFTHAADNRGCLRFAGWGMPVEGGRVLSDDVVELTLGPTVGNRERVAGDRWVR